MKKLGFSILAKAVSAFKNLAGTLGFVALSQLAIAQQESPSFTRFTTAEGLADNWVHTALQDSKGFVWFGCEGGLSRFDGQHFLNFYEEKNNPNSLSNNTVRGICEDPDGSLWLAVLDGGLNHFDPATGQFESWKTDPNNPEFKGELTSILQDGDLLWLGSYHHGLGCFDKKKRKYISWYSFPTDTLSGNTYQFNTINHLIADKQNPRFIWLAAANRGLACFDKQTQYFETWPILDVKGISGVAAMQLMQDAAGRLWIGAWSTGLAMFDPGSGKMTTYPYDLASYSSVSYNRNVVLSVLEKNADELWVATEDHGLGTFNKINHQFNFIENKFSGESPELDRVCQGLYLDPQQRLWVLGRQGGVRVFAPQKQTMRYVSLAAGGGIAEQAEVTDFAYSPSRRSVFVATENNGCFEWSDEKSSLIQRVIPLKDGSFPNFKTILCDAKGNIWAGTAKSLGGEASLYLLRPGKAHFDVAVLKLNPPRGLEETVNDLMEDASGNIWVATSYDGFYRIKPGNSALDYFTEGSGFAKGAPNYNKWWVLLNMREDGNGHIWFALKSGGVIDFDPTARDFKRYSFENLLTSNDALSLETTKDGHIWLGTKNSGLQMFRNGVSIRDSVLVLGNENGLPSQQISAIQKDNTGQLWLATAKGLARFDPKTLRFKLFGKSDGLRSTALNSKGLAVVPGLGVFIGQPNGFCLLRNEAPTMVHDSISMRVVLTDFRIFDQSKYFEKRIGTVKEVRLSPNENIFAFEFAVPSSLDAGLISYQYHLDGFDKNWYTAEGHRSITYAQLAPGSYTFRVRAELGGVFSPETKIVVCILPRWWQTWWAKAAAIFSLGLLLLGGYKYRTRQLKRENELLRQMNELERSALQAQMNPHFIFNCLGAIQNFILQNEKEQAMGYLGDFAGLVRGVLNASVTGQVTLKEELQLLENYLKLEQLRFGQRFDFEIEVATGLDLLNATIPPLLIQPYVENAVLHGMSGKKSGGKVEVFFQKNGNYLEVIVLDNGEGPKTDDSPKTHKSVGMTVTRRRLELLNNKSGGEVVEVKNRLDASGNIAGTEVTIKIDLITDV